MYDEPRPTTGYPIDRPTYEGLMQKIQRDEVGERVGFACNVFPDSDAVFIQRLGSKGDGLAGRVGVIAESKNHGMESFLVSAPEARQIAAALLNAADELDGTTPLTFHPRPAGFFVALDGGNEPTLWREDAQGLVTAVVRRCDVSDPASWAALVGDYEVRP